MLAALVQCGRWGDALILAEALLQERRGRCLALHLAARLKLDYAAALAATGRQAETATLVEEANATLAEVLGPEHPWSCRAIKMLHDCRVERAPAAGH
jgi:hypothetical protein